MLNQQMRKIIEAAFHLHIAGAYCPLQFAIRLTNSRLPVLPSLLLLLLPLERLVEEIALWDPVARLQWFWELRHWGVYRWNGWPLQLLGFHNLYRQLCILHFPVKGMCHKLCLSHSHREFSCQSFASQVPGPLLGWADKVLLCIIETNSASVSVSGAASKWPSWFIRNILL